MMWFSAISCPWLNNRVLARIGCLVWEGMFALSDQLLVLVSPHWRGSCLYTHILQYRCSFTWVSMGIYGRENSRHVNNQSRVSLACVPYKMGGLPRPFATTIFRRLKSLFWSGCFVSHHWQGSFSLAAFLCVPSDCQVLMHVPWVPSLTSQEDLPPCWICWARQDITLSCMMC